MRKAEKQTFSYAVKSEAAQSVTGRKRSDACLLAFLLVADLVSRDRIEFLADNDVTKDMFSRLVCHASENPDAVSMQVIHSRGRSPRYLMRVCSYNDICSVCSRLGIESFERMQLAGKADSLTEKYFGAFVTGLVLSCGGISSPKKEYHLQFALPDDKLSEWFAGVIEERMGISLKSTCRQSQRILYIKGSEGIEDILTLMGAQMSSLEVMNVKVFKDIRNRANRATNCDTANAERQNLSSSRQIIAIREIEASQGGLSQLPDELIEIAKMRLRFPEHSLSELSEEFDPPISKSGVNHRLARIVQIANELRAQKQKPGE